ncbi:uncharacterized protein VICG_00540 [Vittaforma corneae ATCC 50505]|uniref:Uncharacterized protein n=1 Tax=Vittaforma corneae (strain ATCC 50505) TaxID=993615 RepID=L2GNM3_VITCO|nr:uncharacterized protein VICG_00540 [Vittaforma corneae ATCC 50505]ELA42441.1 hypothetical protein VICG_00540 [Vittaforma corneae ATCC 50505]
MMKTKSTKEKQEEILLAYIDIPYFRNNPTYIERWRTYYQRYKDPQILLLMYHKQISTFYHWIYLELSQHFLKKSQPQIAHFILHEALKNNVYDATRIKEAIEKIPPFEKKYSKGDMLGLLNTRNIQALGKTWNCSNETFFYLTNPPKSLVNYEIQKIKNYEEKYAQGKIEMKEIITNFMAGIEHSQSIQQEVNEVTKSEENNKVLGQADKSRENSKPLDKVDKPVETPDNKMQLGTVDRMACQEQNDGIANTMNAKQIAGLHSQECVLFSDAHQKIVEKEPENINQEAEMLANDKLVPVVTIQQAENKYAMNLIGQVEKEYVMDSSSYISIQENEKDDSQVCKKQKIDGNSIFETAFFEISDDFKLNSEICFDRYIYLVQKIGQDGVELLRIAKNADITQTMIGKMFFLKKCSYLSCKIFKNVFGFDACRCLSEYFILYEYSRMCDLKDIISTAGIYVKYFYLKKLLERLLSLMEKGYLLVNTVDFFIDQDFDLGFNCVELCELNDDSLKMVIRLLKETFLTSADELTIDFHMISRLNNQLNTPAAKKEILKHKTEILQSI